MTTNEENLFKEEGYALLGAAFEVYRELGPGFLEEVYHEAMELELSARKIPFISKPRLRIQFKGQPLKKYYDADFLAYDAIVTELKAVRTLAPEHEAQLLNELKATRLRVAYLLNFGASPKLEWYRRVNSSNPVVSVL
jgi:GxxExxY protein